jgi:Na+-transporting NADH:ubiquinone oxidoreductase subunit A
MGEFRIRKGRDINIKGAASKRIVEVPLPPKVAIQPHDFPGLKPRLSVQVGDVVKVGSPLLTDKTHAQIRVVSPASGKVAAINRGEKRALLQIVIETDGRQDAVSFEKISVEEIKRVPREKILALLLEGGAWPVLRQRPFSNLADPAREPKAIFVQAMSTEPLAADADFILKDHQKEFQAGLEALRRLTKGAVHVCYHKNATSKTFTETQNVQTHQFSGPHPSGNVSTHIHYIDPISKGDIVWYLEAQDVVRIARLLLNGSFSPERVVAVTGEGVDEPVYKRTVIGASVHSLVNAAKPGMRYLSGSVLRGTDVGPEGFLCFYDTQITALPRGGERKLLGWLTPGVGEYTFSKTFVSSFLPEQPASLNSDKKGSDRAIVLNDIYDQYVPLDILVNFLLRAVIANDIEEAERLGILECDEEDFALCTFACPSKTDVGGIIRGGLDLIEKEG